MVIRAVYKGFSLIELAVVIAVLAILTAILVPNYTEYLKVGYRADAKTELSRIADRFEGYKSVNHSYLGFDLIQADYLVSNNTNYPKTGTAYYEINLTNVGVGTYTITATPINSTSQAGDGIICLNEEGQKFWSKGATACALSATSTWD